MRYLFEDLASTAIKNTKKIIARYFPTKDWAIKTTTLNEPAIQVVSKYNPDVNFSDIDPKWSLMEYLEYMLRDMLFHGSASQKFEPGAARIAILECKWNPVRGNVTVKYDRIEKLRTILEYISANCIDKFDQNLNNLSYYDLCNMYQDVISADEDENKVVEKTRDPNNKYIIKEIRTFDASAKFREFTNPTSKWCLTGSTSMYKMYTANGRNRMYFCYLPNFKDIKPIAGENAPFDEYGLSLICIIVKPNGKLRAGVTRWNHEHNGGDNTISLKMAKELLGVNDLEEVCPAPKNLKNIDKLAEIDHNNICKILPNIIDAKEPNFKYFHVLNNALQKELSKQNDDFIISNNPGINWVSDEAGNLSNYIEISTTYSNYENYSEDEDLDDDEDDEYVDNDESEESEIYVSIYDIRQNKICVKNGNAKVSLLDNNNNLVVSRSDGLMNMLNTDGKPMLDHYVDKIYSFNDKYACFIDNDKIYILNKNGKILNKNGIGLEHGYPLDDREYKHDNRLLSYGDNILFKNIDGKNEQVYLYNVPRNKFTYVNKYGDLLSSNILLSVGDTYKFINLSDNSVIYETPNRLTYKKYGNNLIINEHCVLYNNYLIKNNIIDFNTCKLINANPVLSFRDPIVANNNNSLIYEYDYGIHIYNVKTDKIIDIYHFDSYPPPDITTGKLLGEKDCIRLRYKSIKKFFDYDGNELNTQNEATTNESFLYKYAAYLLG